jgi:hypothetical protein
LSSRVAANQGSELNLTAGNGRLFACFNLPAPMRAGLANLNRMRVAFSACRRRGFAVARLQAKTANARRSRRAAAHPANKANFAHSRNATAVGHIWGTTGEKCRMPAGRSIHCPNNFPNPAQAAPRNHDPSRARMHDGARMRVYDCLTEQHDLRLVSLAALICIATIFSF